MIKVQKKINNAGQPIKTDIEFCFDETKIKIAGSRHFKQMGNCISLKGGKGPFSNAGIIGRLSDGEVIQVHQVTFSRLLALANDSNAIVV